MMSLFEHKGKVTAQDTFDQAIEKFRNAIQGKINEIQFSNTFAKCHKGRHRLGTAIRRCWNKPKFAFLLNICHRRVHRCYDYTDVQKQALSKGIDFNSFLKYDIGCEASTSQAHNMKKLESVKNISRSD